MRVRKVAVVLIGVAMLILLLVAAGKAEAGETRSVRQLTHRVERLSEELREAKHVLRETRYYSHHDYSDFAGRYVEPGPVGRWVWLAREVGWPWSTIDNLMHIIARESSGCATVPNSQGSGATGLLQLMPMHWEGKFNPKDPRKNLSYGHKLYLEAGWSPWAL